MSGASGPVVIRVLEVAHAVTGEALSPLTARIVPPQWDGWRLTIRGNAVILVADASRLPQLPATCTLGIGLARPAAAALLADGGSITTTITVPADLGGPPAERTAPLLLQPAAAALELHLCDEHGGPLAKRRVIAAPPGHLQARSRVPLAERAPGVYRSEIRTWAAALHPFAVWVDGVSVATRVFDYRTLLTRLRLVVPSQLIPSSPLPSR